MNPKIRKVIEDIERTKTKIAELQTLLPELERKRIDMENTEIIKLVRSADILPAELPAFIESLKAPKKPVFASIGTIEPHDNNTAHPITTEADDAQDDGEYSDDDYPDNEDNLALESPLDD